MNTNDFEVIQTGDVFVCKSEVRLELRDEIGAKVAVIVPKNFSVELTGIQGIICRSVLFEALIQDEATRRKLSYPLGLFLHYFAKIESPVK